MRRISLDFYHRERLAGTASFQVEVRDRPPIDETPIDLDPIIVDRAEDGSVIESRTRAAAAGLGRRAPARFRAAHRPQRRPPAAQLHAAFPHGQAGAGLPAHGLGDGWRATRAPLWKTRCWG
ncbi:MAG: hypothetical protein V9H69_24595 [Anaerolineae bacterium]